jgi:hypothetical protein
MKFTSKIVASKYCNAHIQRYLWGVSGFQIAQLRRKYHALLGFAGHNKCEGLVVSDFMLRVQWEQSAGMKK